MSTPVKFFRINNKPLSLVKVKWCLQNKPTIIKMQSFLQKRIKVRLPERVTVYHWCVETWILEQNSLIFVIFTELKLQISFPLIIIEKWKMMHLSNLLIFYRKYFFSLKRIKTLNWSWKCWGFIEIKDTYQ